MECHFPCTRLNHSWKRIPRSQDMGKFFIGPVLSLIQEPCGAIGYVGYHTARRAQQIMGSRRKADPQACVTGHEDGEASHVVFANGTSVASQSAYLKSYDACTSEELAEPIF